MNVLLLVPPYDPGFMRNARWDAKTISGSNWYPIFLAYCTGLLEKHHHVARLVDAQVDGLSRDEVYRLAREFAPTLTVLYFSMKSLDNDLAIAERIRELTGSEIVLVGHAATFDPVGVLNRSRAVSAIARGEFDFSVLDLANGAARETVRGLVWLDDQGQVRENPPREPIPATALDSYPFVTDVYRRHLRLEHYWLSGHKHPYVDLFTGRGCQWGLCTFCLWPHTMYGGPGPNKYRTRSVSNVLEELRFIRDELPQVREVYLQDDVLPRERARELSEAILENNLKLCWSCYSRADLDLQTLRLMKRAGCYILEVGFESASPQILRNIKKGVTVRQMEEFARNAHRAGLNVIGAFITGLPGETPETIKATIDWLTRLPILRYTITLPKAYPGTGFHAWLAQHDCLDPDGRPNYPGLSTREIYAWNKWSLRRAYFNRRFLWRMLRRPTEWGRVLRSAGFFLPYVFSREPQEDIDLEW